MDPDAAEVKASGGVVWRRARERIEVVVVHRPRYDDWSLPKGKLDAHESWEQAALREVEEETGLSCLLGPELPSTRYTDARGRPKVVRYWRMTVLGGSFEPNREVDEIAWLGPESAAQRLSYDRDVSVLAGLGRDSS